MPEIAIEQVGEEPLEYKVQLTEDEEVVGEYSVVVPEEDYERYGDDVEPQELVKATISFLLSREEPEMILEEFKLGDVERHFPEYPDSVRDYLA